MFGDRHCDKNWFLKSSHDLAGTRVIVLDGAYETPAPKGFRHACDPQGQLCSRRLDWLERSMNEAIGQPVIVILHHPPPPLRISDDTAALQEPDALIDLLAADSDVRQLRSGHIHTTFTTLMGAYLSPPRRQLHDRVRRLWQLAA